MKTAVTIMIIACCAAACSGKSSDQDPPLLGGCRLDTIKAGLETAAPGEKVKPGGTRLDVLSIKFAGEKLYRESSLELTSVMDSLGIGIIKRTNIIHVTEGPCWPPYRVSHQIAETDESSLEELRKALLSVKISGRRPSEKRPPGYGTFFITCVRGDRDLWTIWYDGGERQ